MSMWKRPELIFGMVVLCSLAGYMVLRTGPIPSARGPELDVTAPAHSHHASATQLPRAETEAPAEPDDTTLPRYRGPERSADKASLLREALIARKAQQLGATSALAGAHMPDRDSTGNQVGKPLGDYVRRVMQEQFLPLAGECYEQLLAHKPEMAGNVELEFSILGDPSVGGVVVDVDLADGTTLRDPDFRTCMTESMYSVIFDAPPGNDGSVSVKQSFELSP